MNSLVKYLDPKPRWCIVEYITQDYWAFESYLPTYWISNLVQSAVEIERDGYPPIILVLESYHWRKNYVLVLDIICFNG